jgi:hypothetical protein
MIKDYLPEAKAKQTDSKVGQQLVFSTVGLHMVTADTHVAVSCHFLVSCQMIKED